MNDDYSEIDFSRIFRFTVLETERLKLRRITAADTDDMYDYSCRDDVTRYLLWSPHPSRDHTRRYINSLQSAYRSGRFFDWGIEYKPDGRFVGTCGFVTIDLDNNCAEIGYVINPHYQNMGIATEAVRAAIEFGFSELKLNRIEARYMVGNDASRRVMEKSGMTFEGVRRSLLYVKDKYVDIGTCAILRCDFTPTGCCTIIENKPSLHSLIAGK